MQQVRIPVPSARAAPPGAYGSAATARVQQQQRFVTPPHGHFDHGQPQQHYQQYQSPQMVIQQHHHSSPLKGQSLEPTVHVYHSHNQELERLQHEINGVAQDLNQYNEYINPATSIHQSREIELEFQVKDSQKRIEDQNLEIEKLKIKLREKEQEAAEFSKSLEDKNKNLESLQQNNDTMRQKQSEFLTSVNEQVTTFENEFEAKNARITELLSENRNLQADYDDCMEKLRKAEGHIDQQQEEVEAEKEHVLELMDEVLTLRANSKTLHIAIDTLKNTHDKERKQFETQLDDYKQSQDNKDLNAINLNAEIADLRDQLAQQQHLREDMLEFKNREQMWGESQQTHDDEMIVKERLQAAREKRELENQIKMLKKEIHVLSAVPAVPEATFRALREHQKDQAVNQNRKDEMKILRLQQEVEMYKQQLSGAAPAR